MMTKVEAAYLDCRRELDCVGEALAEHDDAKAAECGRKLAAFVTALRRHLGQRRMPLADIMAAHNEAG